MRGGSVGAIATGLREFGVNKEGKKKKKKKVFKP